MPKENMFEHYSGKTKYVQKPKAGPVKKRWPRLRVVGDPEGNNQGLLLQTHEAQS
jgi:hypothetical protein